MRAVSRPVRPIVEAFQSVSFTARQPSVHGLPMDAPVVGYEFGSGTEIRTLNLAVNSRLAATRLQGERSGRSRSPSRCTPQPFGINRSDSTDARNMKPFSAR